MKRNLNNFFISLICGLVLTACGTSSGPAGNSNFLAPIPMGIASIPLNTPTGSLTATAIVDGSPSVPNLSIDSSKTVSGTISLTSNVNHQMYLQFAVGSVVIGTTKTQTISVTPGGSTTFSYAPTDINYNHGAVFTLTKSVLHPAGIDVVTGSDGDPVALYFSENTGNNDIKKIDFSTNPISISTVVSGLVGPNYIAHAYGAGTFENIYFADNDHTIKSVDLGTKTVTTICGISFSPGYTNGTCGSAQFNTPIGLAYKKVQVSCRLFCTGFDDYLIVSEWGNLDLRYIDVTNKQVYQLSNGYTDLTTIAAKGAPDGLSYDSVNDVVYFTNLSQIGSVTPVSATFAAANTAISGPNSGGALSGAWAVFFDSSTGQIYVVDNTKHMVYTGMPGKSTTVTPFIGNGVAATVDEVGLSASVNNIADIKGTSKFLFLSDWNDSVIRVVVR